MTKKWRVSVILFLSSSSSGQLVSHNRNHGLHFCCQSRVSWAIRSCHSCFGNDIKCVPHKLSIRSVLHSLSSFDAFILFISLLPLVSKEKNQGTFNPSGFPSHIFFLSLQIITIILIVIPYAAHFPSSDVTDVCGIRCLASSCQILPFSKWLG